MHLFWNRLRKRPFNLRKGGTMGLFILTNIAGAILQALIIGPAVAMIYPEVDIMLFATTVICNGSLFPLAFAIPFIILIQEELGFAPLSSKKQLEA